MRNLRDSQKRFLVDQNIPLSSVLDATGIPRKVYQPMMKELGKEVAIGVTPCRVYGHEMRTRHGHCVQCNTQAIAFMRRFHESAYVYILESQSESLVKVGTTGNLRERVDQLNYYGYGGCSDWRLFSYKFCEFAARVENRVHKKLSGYLVDRSYFKDGFIVDCQEIFDCNPARASKALHQLSGG
ncbi:GIY-YIG nuclease family protein [Thioalkalivibrio sp. ALJ24]|uniref:GIY-YIG nuclease family protein n=1 Tax=Thioalkalivibrio sp. ALJ24 TaxID=545276 RepID=UPI0009FCB10A